MIVGLIDNVRYSLWFLDGLDPVHSASGLVDFSGVASWASGHVVPLFLVGVALLVFTYGSGTNSDKSLPQRATTKVSLLSLLVALVQIFGHNIAELGTWLAQFWPFG